MPQLAALVREKHPGVYDDMDDATLEAAVRAKYPGVYDDLAEPEQKEHPYNIPKDYGQMSRDQKIEWHMNDPLTTGAATGGLSPGNLAPRIVHGIAKAVMGKALGSQTPVQRAFRNVDLPEEALKYGTNPKRLDVIGKEAAKDVVAQGRAADASGVAPIRASEIVAGLRPAFDRAVKAERTGIKGGTQRVVDTAQLIRRSAPKGGVSIEDALVGKSEWQAAAKDALRAAPGELKGPTPRIARAVGGTIKNAIRGRNVEPLNKALDKSQAVMALQRAAETMSFRPSLLQMMMGGASGAATGFGTGDWKAGVAAAAVPMAMSPRGLSAMARGIDASDPVVRPALEAIVRSILVGGSPGDPEQK